MGQSEAGAVTGEFDGGLGGNQRLKALTLALYRRAVSWVVGRGRAKFCPWHDAHLAAHARPTPDLIWLRLPQLI